MAKTATVGRWYICIRPDGSEIFAQHDTGTLRRAPLGPDGRLGDWTPKNPPKAVAEAAEKLAAEVGL